MYRKAKEFGLLPEKPQWELYSHQSPNNFFVKDMSREDFQRMVTKMIRAVDKYNTSLKAIIKRIKPKRKYFLKKRKINIKTR